MATRALLPVTCAVLLLAAAACETMPRGSDQFWKADRQQQFGPGQITPAGVQSEIMGFADLYADVVSQVLDAAFLDAGLDGRTRLVAQSAKLDMIENALHIASGPNPIVSMLDMTVMVALQRHALKTHWLDELFDDETDRRILAAMERLDAEVWSIVERALDEEQQGALRELIDQMCVTYGDQRYVSGIRASEFAEDRQKTFVTLKGGGSLLTLFALDPLANLSPATREIIESRLLAERAFFFAARLPEMLRGHARVLGLEYAAIPESQRILDRVDESVASVQRAVELAESLPDRVTAEREAAIDQIFDRLESDEEQLRGTLAELRTAVEAGARLSDSLQTTLVEGRDLAGALTALKEPTPGSRPLDLRELESVTIAATETVRELNAALASAQQLLADDAWHERESQLRQATTDVQLGIGAIVDRVFWRVIVLAAAIGVIVVVTLAVNRRLARRGSGSGAAHLP